MNSHKKYLCHLQTIITVIVLIFILLTVIVGAIWMFLNISNIPAYIDSKEYLDSSESLAVHRNRVILYPYFIYLSNYIANLINLKVQNIVYFFQILLTFSSSSLLAYTILPYGSQARAQYSRQLIAFFTGVIVLFNPLVTHFSLSIMTDSVATSLTMIFLSFLILATNNKNKKTLYIAIAAIFFILMSLVRVEKVYLGIIGFLSFLALYYFQNRHSGNCNKNIIIFSICAVFIAILCINFVKNETRVTYDTNKLKPPAHTIYNMAFYRAVWPRMSDAYEYFPENIKEKITKDDAENFDNDNNNVYPFLTEILHGSDGEEIIQSITFITLKHFPFQIAAKTAFDFTKYTLPNISFPLEAIGILPTSFSTPWAITRMEMSQPTLTKIFLSIGTLSFFLMLAYNVITIRFQRRREKLLVVTTQLIPTLILTGAVIITNSMIFTLESGIDAHIRYALPSYTIILTWTVAFFGYIFQELIESARSP